jgi:hypothetical protein
MPINRETCLVQAVFALAQGAGAGTSLADDACQWFHHRYHPWIEQRKQNGKRALDVWEKDGKDFLQKFHLMGQRAAEAAARRTGARSTDTVIESSDLESAAVSVEQESECPYCPINP